MNILCCIRKLSKVRLLSVLFARYACTKDVQYRYYRRQKLSVLLIDLDEIILEWDYETLRSCNPEGALRSVSCELTDTGRQIVDLPAVFERY